MRHKAYPKYKSSGVEWLGELPEHWEVKRLGFLCLLESGESITSELIAEGGEFPVFGGNGFGGFYHRYTHDGHFVLIGRQGALCGNINYAVGKFWASEHALIVIPIAKWKVAWMGELLRAMNLGRYSVTAAQPGLSAEMLRRLRVPVPPLPEQTAIAAFLDRETGRIDRLVAKKRELIERLKEKRTALISRTVTRGLPPAAARAAGLPENPLLKPSGVEWLGEIPNHWHLLPVTKYLSEKSDYRGKTPNKQPEGVFLVTARNVRMGYIDYVSSQEFIAEDDYDEVVRRGLPKKGDILFTTEAPLGNVALVDREDVALAQRIIRFRMSLGRFRSPFVLFAMMSDHFQVQLKSLSTGSTAEGVKASKLPMLRLIAPPVSEQTVIADYLDAETAKLDALVAKVEAAIERLQEYRTALITAAVTGKIDVREESAA